MTYAPQFGVTITNTIMGADTSISDDVTGGSVYSISTVGLGLLID